MIGKTEGINHYTVEHTTHGRGGAILVKHRPKPKDDLFMCSFTTLKGKTFYCRKHFDRAGEIWFVNENEPLRKRSKKQSKADELEEQLRQFFFSAQS